MNSRLNTRKNENILENKIKRKEAIALFRLQIISPMLDAPKGQVDATAQKLAKQTFNDVINQKMVSFHERTIYQYYMDYKKCGFEGLIPKVYKNKGTHPSIPDSIIKEIIFLKEELPTRSAQKIITLMELSKKIEKDSLYPRTVNRILKRLGYTTQTLMGKSRVYKKFEKDAIGKMWQSDYPDKFIISILKRIIL